MARKSLGHVGIALVLAAFAGALQPVLAAEVQGVRIWAGPERTRVVLDVTDPVDHTLFTLTSPNRVVVDLHRGRIDLDAARLPPGQGAVRRIRSANKQNGDVRVVLDLAETAHARSFLVPPTGQYGHRVVIDLSRPSGTAPVVVSRPTGSGPRDFVVAIDPGHGGEDPGAVGRSGTREKDIVLDISRRLKKQVDAEPGMRAVLIRDGDYYVPHRRRMQIARQHRADLFVSIHADAFKDRRARGSSVYVLSQRGASDEAARWLAERENAADLVGGVSLDDKDQVLASVLLDLSQSAAIDASQDAAARVLNQLGGVNRLHKPTVQRAGFLVLKSPDIPSLLVETAFISNPSEERQLKSSSHQDAMAKAILFGVRSYYYDNPPPGTMVAVNGTPRPRRPDEHIIMRGDTLSGIAHRYRVSLSSLRRHNNLRGDRIRIGQKIKIPPSGG